MGQLIPCFLPHSEANVEKRYVPVPFDFSPPPSPVLLMMLTHRTSTTKQKQHLACQCLPMLATNNGSFMCTIATPSKSKVYIYPQKPPTGATLSLSSKILLPRLSPPKPPVY
uniref:Uncharacterized protein n=1 Tax=Schistocephalus solidus TaxID=70667 RepID=A0A0X3P9K9_SCHSO